MFQGFWMRLKKSGVAFISSFLAGMVVAIVLDALGANKDFVEIAAFVTVAIVIFMMIDPIATYVTAAVVLFIMIDPLGLRKRK